MREPYVRSGKFHAGADFVCGNNVVIDVAEECIVGDRCTLPDNAYLGGRRVEIGTDFYGYSWEWRRLDVGRGRHDDEDAVLKVGDRCTFHDNLIDLSRHVTVGDDVGLSPQVTIYTHGYWMSSLQGFPCAREPVRVGSGTIVGFRSTLLPGADAPDRCVIGAGAVVAGRLHESHAVYGGVPAHFIRRIEQPLEGERRRLLKETVDEYKQTLVYRKLTQVAKAEIVLDFPWVKVGDCWFDCDRLVCEGEEDALTDDWRDFAFRRGLRFYTKRRFKRLEA